MICGMKTDSLKGKKVIVTAGGTIEPIDDIRHIGNFASGKFPSRIAEECLERGADVIYIHAKSAMLPFEREFKIDLSESTEKELVRIKEIKKKYNILNKKLHPMPIKTVSDYKETVKEQLDKGDIDIIFLSMAVSDYRVDNPKKGKISSKNEELTIKLKRNPKIITKIKEWSGAPIFQVGFKLLSNVSEEELAETGYESGLSNKSNLTVANDLQNTKDKARSILMITPEGGIIRSGGSSSDVAKELVSFVSKRENAGYFKTEIVGNFDCSKDSPEILKDLKEISEFLIAKKLIRKYTKDRDAYYGSIAIRGANNEFIVTSRGSHKKNLKETEVSLVEKVDFEEKVVYAKTIDKKPSLNTPLLAAIFKEFSQISYIVHTHHFVQEAPTTNFENTPGTTKEINSVIPLLKEFQVVNLKNHGAIAIGKSKVETLSLLS